MQKIAVRELRTRFLLAEADALILFAAGVVAAWIRFGSAGFDVEVEPDSPAPRVHLLRCFGPVRPRHHLRSLPPIELANPRLPSRPDDGTGRHHGRRLWFSASISSSHGVSVAACSPSPSPSRCRCRSCSIHLAEAGDPAAGPRRHRHRRRSHRRRPPHANSRSGRTHRFELPVTCRRPSTATPTRSTESTSASTDLIIVAQLTDDDPTIDRLAALNFRGTTVVDAAGAYAALTGRIPVRQVDSRWFIATGDFSSIATSPFHYLQRFFDLFSATDPAHPHGAGAPRRRPRRISSPDGSPVIYRQQRLGRFGQPFELLKLRTMQHELRCQRPDLRRGKRRQGLPVGRLLRRWRIDELPQLINVLRGEMSLVGPRPERPDVAARFERKIPFYAFRYSVRPGSPGGRRSTSRIARGPRTTWSSSSSISTPSGTTARRCTPSCW